MDAFIVVMIFLTIQVFANKIISSSSLDKIQWMSLAGGIAVSYIFVYILPSLHHEQEDFGETAFELAMESELYFFGLIGIVVFYTLTKIAERHRHQKNATIKDRFFFVQIVLFFMYNTLISYIMFAADQDIEQLVFYGTAVGLHFMTVAHDMYRENSERYLLYGRYVLAAGIFIGWAVATFVPHSSVVLAIVFSFISGAIMFNVIKNELPSEDSAHLPTFVISAFTYSGITLLLKFFLDW
ncbi:hypothetical protein [Alkalicoccus daliensis]|uniref:ZIP Zinc transporter n=1 Tax=Alkalicoccus daliensis TaxID=745820 RepID=A0A1H0GXV2_9BACI|nr:hypothetical protein [Alkalicoccus daliensis]SDO11710.1 hypothetical protein SAMN04488053_10785 [Alkalicoccus daliensis]